MLCENYFDNIIKSNFSYMMNSSNVKKTHKTRLYKHTLGVLLKNAFSLPK